MLRAWHSQKEKKLASERDELKARLNVVEKENSQLTAAAVTLTNDKSGLLEEQRRLKSELIMTKDEVEVLNQRVVLLNGGYRHNRELVRTIISTTTNGFDDGDGPGNTDAAVNAGPR
jgi:chromosome segregation ATPase